MVAINYIVRVPTDTCTQFLVILLSNVVYVFHKYGWVDFKVAASLDLFGDEHVQLKRLDLP